MSQEYYNPPNAQNEQASNKQEPVLKDEDAKFLENHISNNEGTQEAAQDVQTTVITEDGTEKEATRAEQAQVGDDQLVAPELPPRPGTQRSEQSSYDDTMKERAAAAVKARKEKRKQSMNLPSQEEAEATTRGYHAQSGQDTERPRSERSNWTSFLSSMATTPFAKRISLTTRPQSSQGDSQIAPNGDSQTGKDDSQIEKGDKQSAQDSDQRTWTQYASTYVPAIPSSWKLGKDKDAAPPEPVYNEDGTINEEKTQEQQAREVSALLSRLDLSAMNNRVFAFSTETQKIYERFAQVLKDMINGVPTAYDDMETLFKEAGPKLEQQFKGMPPFVQTLVKSLPAKIGTSFYPELVAAAAEKPDASLKTAQTTSTGTEDGKKEKKKRRIPGLKSLVSREGAVATMLRNVVTFLQTRFPFLASTTNVAMSLAVFILMFVFWYCYKRGREVRLAKEAAEGQGAVVGEDDEISEEDDEEADDIDEKAAELEKDVETKSNILNQPDPSEVPLPDKDDGDGEISKPS